MPQQVTQTVFEKHVSDVKEYLIWYGKKEEEAAAFIIVEHVSTGNYIKEVILKLIEKNEAAELQHIQQLIQDIQSLKIKPQDNAYFEALSSAISFCLAENNSLVVSLAGMSFTPGQ